MAGEGGLCLCVVVAIAMFMAAVYDVAGPSGNVRCAQGYQPIVQPGKVDESVSSLLQTRAAASGKEERQLTDSALLRMGVHVYDHNCSWAARQPPWSEIEGGCTITAIEHCWHTSHNDCFDTYGYTLTRGPPSYFFGSAGSFTATETIRRTRGASCARDKGCAADGWEDGPPFGTRKLGEVSRCWAPSTGEEEWLPQSMCVDVDACFKMFDPYEEMQQAAESALRGVFALLAVPFVEIICNMLYYACCITCWIACLVGITCIVSLIWLCIEYW